MSEGLVSVIGNKLLTQGLKEIDASELKDKIVALYFSAHWCPPCRQFTPILANVYTTLVKSGKPFEVIFVSSDSDDEAFAEYFGTHPWKAIPFDEEEKRQALGEQFGVRGIPALIVLNKDGKVISKDGRTQVMQEKEKAFDKWSA